jgi:hypothetical protein
VRLAVQRNLPPPHDSYSEVHLSLAAARPPALHEPPCGHSHSDHRGTAKNKQIKKKNLSHLEDIYVPFTYDFEEEN